MVSTRERRFLPRELCSARYGHTAAFCPSSVQFSSPSTQANVGLYRSSVEDRRLLSICSRVHRPGGRRSCKLPALTDRRLPVVFSQCCFLHQWSCTITEEGLSQENCLRLALWLLSNYFDLLFRYTVQKLQQELQQWPWTEDRKGVQ